MMGMEEGALLKRGDGWLSAWVGKEHVMMSAETGTCISLSETGGRIWELLEAPQSILSLCSTLAAEYDAAPEVIRDQVELFLSDLRAREALQIVQ